MKSRKVIYLTVTIVAIALVSILGLSKIFEISWQAPGEVDNNLNVDNDTLNQETMIINYPYYMLNDHAIFDNKDFQEEYPVVYARYIQSGGKTNYIYNNIVVPDTNLTHQDIANICGETIKYLYGRSDLQNNKATVLYREGGPHYNNELMAIYRYKEEFEMYLNTLTCEIEFLECKTKGANITPNNPNTSEFHVDYFTDDVKVDIEQMIYETMSVINPDFEIVNIEYFPNSSMMLNGLYSLSVAVEDESNNRAGFGFHTNDFDVYELSYYDKDISW
ncbi:MAG: hypothetical protein IKK99_03120 [Oscillospiraceae bacterium]|nr:hypothetical protein [Oscillospiraceae bacterium]